MPIPIDQIVFPGGDMSLITNLEYRITIYGPVALAPFLDTGIEDVYKRQVLWVYYSAKLGKTRATAARFSLNRIVSDCCIKH